MYEEFFPDRLNKLRNQLNVSARDMSLSIGQNPGYINNIETGKALPSMTSFFYICEYLKITPQEFFDTGSVAPHHLNLIIEELKRLDEEQLDIVSRIIASLSKVKKD